MTDNDNETRIVISTPDTDIPAVVDWWALVDAQQRTEQGKTGEEEQRD